MAPTARPHATSRSVAIALLLLGFLLLAAGIVYLTTPAYGLPWYLPHQVGSIYPSVRRGSAAVILPVLCFLGSWLAARR